MRESSWRKSAREVITKVVEENPDASIEELRKLVSDAYPFGERKYHPYKMWLSAVKELLSYDGKRLVTKSDVRNMWI